MTDVPSLLMFKVRLQRVRKQDADYAGNAHCRNVFPAYFHFFIIKN